MGRSVKYVNRLKKLYGKANFLVKLAKFPLIKRWVRKQVQNDTLFYLTKDTVIPVDQEVQTPDDIILPSKIVEHFIKKANNIWIMDFCICREGAECENYPRDLGCIFMGDAVLNINPEFGKLVSKKEALEHVEKCREAGLVHTIGRNKLDAVWLGAWPEEKLLTICNCCECCCISQYVAKLGPKIGKAAVKLPGVSVNVSGNCLGCGICAKDVCLFEAIKLKQKKAVINQDKCRACGRCIEVCPQKAISLTIENQRFIHDTIERVDALVDIS